MRERSRRWLLLFVVSGCTSSSNIDASVDAVFDSGDASDELAPLPVIPPPDAAPNEALRLRRTLGIPDEAQRVLVLGQNSHLDLDWLRTMETYYTSYVEQIYTQALDAIAADPDYRYATAELGYLRMFWERKPSYRNALLSALRSGQFQIVGGGVSQPDTLLPMGENLVRDYLAGNRWLRSIGASRTNAAYLPDSFGLSPSTPDVLFSAGFRSVAFWRADGTSDVPEFNASVADFAQLPVTPGTNAATLRAAQQIDFLWEGSGGARIFAHWLTNGYMFGDYLDFQTINFRQYGRPVGLQLRDHERVADNLQLMIDQLAPQAPTDYLFVPVGGDFQYPKPALAAYARHYNRSRFPRTRVWVRSGTFAEFAQLAMTQSERLPVRRLDLTPYWMGFYASRPQLKDLARRGSCAIDQAHRALAVARSAGLNTSVALDELEWTAGITNHHDWITGTSVDPVTYNEQVPTTTRLLQQAQTAVETLVQQLANASAGTGLHGVVFNSESHRREGIVQLPVTLPSGAQSATVRFSAATNTPEATVEAHVSADRSALVFSAPDVPSVGYRSMQVTYREVVPVPGVQVQCFNTSNAAIDCAHPEAATLRAQTTQVRLLIDLQRAGTLTSYEVNGSEMLRAPSSELVVYEDSGGLYTFGNESGGRYSQGYLVASRAENRTVRVVEQGPSRTIVQLSFTAMGLPYRVEYRIPTRGTMLDANITAQTAPGTALVLRYATNLRSDGAWMAVPGGVVRRAAGGRFAPTFVPFEQWFAYETADAQRGFTLVAPSNPAVTFDTQGQVELVLHRNAPTSDHGPSGLGGSTNDTVTLAVRFAPYVQPRSRRLHFETAADLFFPLHARAVSTAGGALPVQHSLLTVEGNAVVSAARTPSDGSNGLIVRFTRTENTNSELRVHTPSPYTMLEMVDAMEQQPQASRRISNDWNLALEQALTTIRLR